MHASVSMHACEGACTATRTAARTAALVACAGMRVPRAWIVQELSTETCHCLERKCVLKLTLRVVVATRTTPALASAPIVWITSYTLVNQTKSPTSHFASLPTLSAA
eukprot:4403255-Pleurochrysis_carterae.AAC.2